MLDLKNCEVHHSLKLHPASAGFESLANLFRQERYLNRALAEQVCSTDPKWVCHSFKFPHTLVENCWGIKWRSGRSSLVFCQLWGADSPLWICSCQRHLGRHIGVRRRCSGRNRQWLKFSSWISKVSSQQWASLLAFLTLCFSGRLSSSCSSCSWPCTYETSRSLPDSWRGIPTPAAAVLELRVSHATQ